MNLDIQQFDKKAVELRNEINTLLPIMNSYKMSGDPIYDTLSSYYSALIKCEYWALHMMEVLGEFGDKKGVEVEADIEEQNSED